MKKFLLSILVFSLVSSLAFCSGNREVNLKTIFLGNSEEVQKSLEEKHPTQSPQPIELVKSTTETKTLPVKLDEEKIHNKVEDMKTEELIDEIISNSTEVDFLKEGLIHSLSIIEEENQHLSSTIEDQDIYIKSVEKDLEKEKQDNIDKTVLITNQKGSISTLEEKLKNKKSYKYLLVGGNYSLNQGYGVSLDMGVKFDLGLTTQFGVSVPLDRLNPIGLLDINSYEVSAKVGWSW